MKGKFVTFEGCEGVGKSTQLALLKDYLAKTNQQAVYTREPGGTSIGEQIRTIILSMSNTEMDDKTEALLYAASRAQHVAEFIIPCLQEGKLVICDRYIDSSIAYQGGARGLGVDYVKKINEDALKLATPDVTIFLDLTPENNFRAIKTEDRLEQESNDFHNIVYKTFVSEAENSNGRIVRIVPCQNKYETHNKILKVLREKGVIK